MRFTRRSHNLSVMNTAWRLHRPCSTVKCIPSKSKSLLRKPGRRADSLLVIASTIAKRTRRRSDSNGANFRVANDPSRIGHSLQATSQNPVFKPATFEIAIRVGLEVLQTERQEDVARPTGRS